jgi:hypothetical protein
MKHPITAHDAPWRALGRLAPWRLLVRELLLAATIVERDWTSDDTTPADDARLRQVAEHLREAAKLLGVTFEEHLDA